MSSENKVKYYRLTKAELDIYNACLNKTDAYNLSNYLLLDNDIDLYMFKEAVKKTFKNHPYLFTVLVLDKDGNPIKCIVENEIEVKDVIKEENFYHRSTPFKLLNRHLYRVDIVHYKDQLYFHFDIHQIIFDKKSVKLFIDEIIDTYNGLEPQVEIKNCNDYEIEEAKASRGEKYNSSKEFYTAKLENVKCDTCIIEDNFYPGENSIPENKRVNVSLNIDNSKVEELVNSLEIDSNSLFNSLFGLLLSKTNFEDEFLFTTSFDGRKLFNNEDYLNSIGMFNKPFFYYSKVDYELSIKDYLVNSYNDLKNYIDNISYSYSDCVNELGIKSDISFNYQNESLSLTKYNDQKLITQTRHENKEKLSFELFKDNNQYNLSIDYRSDLYEERTIRTLAKHFETLINYVLDNNSNLLKDIDLLDEEEAKILDNYNFTKFDYVDFTRNILTDFKEIVKKNPTRTCVVYNDKSYTYKQVDELANSLARKLIELGADKEKIVSILLRKSEFIVIASLAVLKANAAYQPIDIYLPKKQLNKMIKDSEAIAIICDDEFESCIENFDGTLIKTSEICSLDYPKDSLEIKVEANDLFIILNTSGTTGKPKNVMLEHKNVYAFSKYFAHTFLVDNKSKTATIANYWLDDNIADIYPYLISGSTIYIIDDELKQDLTKLGEYFDKVGITHALLPTKLGRKFVEEVETRSLKHLFVSGEKLLPITSHNSYCLYNVYGPTEGTVICSGEIVNKMYRRVPIGKCNDNYKVYILDNYGHVLPRKTIGELYISGPQVARGYLGKKKENKEAFLDNKFDDKEMFNKLYKTGDIVRMLDNGSIDFIKRLEVED